MRIITINEYHKLSIEEKHSFTGIIKSEIEAIAYLKNGEPHRLDGPAVIWKKGPEEYWINNIRYTKEDYWKHPDVIINSKEFKDLLKYKELI